MTRNRPQDLRFQSPATIWRLVVDGLTSPATLSRDLPVVDPDDEAFDAGADAAVSSAVVVLGDSAVGSAAWSGDGVDSAIAAVAEDWPAAVV